MRFRPCIDIHQGKVKQIIGSTLNNKCQELQTNFVADMSAADFAVLYKKDKLFGGHIAMLDDSLETRQEAISALETFPKGLQIGGGITIQNAQEFLDRGASRVVVSSYIFTGDKFDREKLFELNRAIKKKYLVLDLSCRKKDDVYIVAKDKWQTFTDLKIDLKTMEFLAGYCDEFLIHSIDWEGKKQGVDRELLKLIGGFKKIPVTYAGGIGCYDEIEFIKEIGQGSIDFTIGSALDIFGGQLSYTKIKQIC